MHRFEDHEGSVPEETSAVPTIRPGAGGPGRTDSAESADDARSLHAPGSTRAMPVNATTRIGGRAPADVPEPPTRTDATRAITVPDGQVIREVGGYRLLTRLGSGGMGTVYEALDAEDRSVALKLIHPHVAADPAARRRLAREVSLLHRIKGEGVARVLDAEVDGAEAFVVTELIEGPTLEEDVEAHGPFEPDELSGLAHGLADALAAIHAAGVVHRDLKPSNVMLSPAGPVLIDFGIAQVADDVRLTQTGMVTGTPGYLDPEVISGAEPSPECDWWAWAAVLLFAATGRPPFGQGTMATVLQRVAGGHAQTDGAEESVGVALRSALDPTPERRLGHESVLDVLDGKWSTQDVVEATAFLATAPVDGDDDEDGDDATRAFGGARGGADAGRGGEPQRTSILPGGVAAASAATVVAGLSGAGAGVGAGGGSVGGGAQAGLGANGTRMLGADQAGVAGGGTPTTVVRGRPGEDEPSFDPVHAPVYLPAARYGSTGGPGIADPTAGPGATRVAPVGYSPDGSGWGGPGAGAEYSPGDSGPGGGARTGTGTEYGPGGGAGFGAVGEGGAGVTARPGTGYGPVGAPGVATHNVFGPGGAPGSGTVTGHGPGHPPGTATPADPFATPPGTGPGGMVPPRHLGAQPMIAPDGSRLPVPPWLREPPYRTVSVAVLWLATAPLAAVAPGWYLVGTATLLTILGAAGWSGRARRLTRRKMGLRRGDSARSLLRLPWDLVLSLGSLLLGVVFAGTVWLLSYYVVEGLAAAHPFAEHITVGASGALAVATAWLTPTSYSQRLGAREVLETLTPGRGARAAILGIAVLVCAAVLIGIGTGALGAPSWPPLAPPPELGSIFLV